MGIVSIGATTPKPFTSRSLRTGIREYGRTRRRDGRVRGGLYLEFQDKRLVGKDKLYDMILAVDHPATAKHVEGAYNADAFKLSSWNAQTGRYMQDASFVLQCR